MVHGFLFFQNAPKPKKKIKDLYDLNGTTPYKTEEIVHERLGHRINYADGIAYIESLGGRPVTQEELRNKLRENGRPLYLNEIQWTPIWVNSESK